MEGLFGLDLKGVWGGLGDLGPVLNLPSPGVLGELSGYTKSNTRAAMGWQKLQGDHRIQASREAAPKKDWRAYRTGSIR